MRGLVVVTALLGGIASSAGGAEATVSELLVKPEARCLAARPARGAAEPRILSTFPTSGAVVRPGKLVLRVTFDQPMSCSGFFVTATGLASPCPSARQHMVLSFDRRTVRLACATAANTAYGVGVGQKPAKTFVSLAGRAAEPVEITFTTSGAPPVMTIAEALAQDQ